MTEKKVETATAHNAKVTGTVHPLDGYFAQPLEQVGSFFANGVENPKPVYLTGSEVYVGMVVGVPTPGYPVIRPAVIVDVHQRRETIVTLLYIGNDIFHYQKGIVEELGLCVIAPTERRSVDQLRKQKAQEDLQEWYEDPTLTLPHSLTIRSQTLDSDANTVTVVIGLRGEPEQSED